MQKKKQNRKKKADIITNDIITFEETMRKNIPPDFKITNKETKKFTRKGKLVKLVIIERYAGSL